MNNRDDEQARIPVVGIGASAGGVEALLGFFEAVPDDVGLAYVVVVHLAPDRESELPEILARRTAMPVTQVADHDTVDLEANHVYVIAPDRKLEITDTSVGASPFEQPRGQRAAIDLFFRSLAVSHDDGFAVVLSGSGADGAVGAKAVKEAGGLVLVQDPREAGHEGMPRAVIATGCADVVLPVRKLAARLAELARNKQQLARIVRVRRGGEPQIEDDERRRLEEILELLRSRTGHDFLKYKRATILRRISRRMQLSHQHDLGGYLRYVRENPEETLALFDDLLISVTTFFRDPGSWAALAEQVIGPLVERSDPEEQIRCWVPGCATGEEAYTLAMLFQEEIERRKLERNVIVFASDVDEGALSTAREGLYPSAIAADVSEPRLERFFRARGDHYRIASDIRERVVFAAHSLLRDPPFSKLHVVSCRNLLIYLDHELQGQIMRVLQYACRDEGYLFLGISESADDELFRSLDKKHRILQVRASADKARHVPPDLLAARRAPPRQEPRPRSAHTRAGPELHVRSLEELAPPSVLVDERWTVLHMSDSAARYLQQQGGPPARALTDLARLELRNELHGVLRRAFDEQGRHLSRFVPVGFNGASRMVGVLAQVREQKDGARNYALVTFLEAGEAAAGEAHTEQEPTSELVRNLREQLRQAELRAESMRDDQHLANEDLRAANEELQSLNEEYRSSTEELETSKEELQSINEELQTVNNELETKLEEVSRAHNDLENLMAATDIATLFLDRELNINRFTPQLAELFNVRSHDLGRPIADFTHALDYDGLEADARRVLAELAPIRREAGTHGGRALIVRLRPYRTAEDRIEGVVVTLVDVTELKQAQQVLAESEERFRALVEASAQMVWTTDAQGRVVEDSPTWRAYTGQRFDQWKGAGWLDAVHPEDREMAEAAWRGALESGSPMTSEFRVYHAPTGKYRWTSVRAAPLHGADGGLRGWVGMNIDVDERREAVEALREADLHKDEFLAMLGHELRNPLAAIRNSLEALAATESVGDPAAARVWAVIDRQSRHIHRLVNDLLDVTRIKRGKLRLSPERLELTACIRDALEAVQTEIDAKRLELELDLPEHAIHLEADPERLVQVLDNLLRNAINYTPAGGRIGLRAARDAEHAVVTVWDTGAGIDPGEVSSLFDPYYQSELGRGSSGLGLGLTLAKRLVEMHGGTIDVQSDGQDAGSEFKVTLPRGDTGAASPTPAGRNVPKAARHRVLVADDQADVADAFASLLEGLGQDVAVAYGGEAALEAARARRPRIVFLDLSMPDMTGWEAAERLRAEFPAEEMFLVALTGYGEDRAAARGSGFDRHLVKPADVHALVELLNSTRPSA